MTQRPYKDWNQHERETPIESISDAVCYNPETGSLTWRHDRHYNAKAGDEVGCLSGSSGRRFRFNGKRKFFAHRVAWALVYGRWPEAEIDHRNGDPADNRLVNLREATRTQQRGNQRPSGASGVRGVSWNKEHQKWHVAVGKKYHGRFTDLAEAQAVAQSAAAEFYGPYALHLSRR
jgi:HNH endonuclease